jgi:hypothetical protein
MVEKIIQVVGSSTTSFEDAVNNGLKEVAQTVRNISEVKVLGFFAKVENNKIIRYNADLKIKFEVER